MSLHDTFVKRAELLISRRRYLVYGLRGVYLIIVQA